MNVRSHMKVHWMIALLSILCYAIPAAAQDKLYNNEFALTDVRLLPGPFLHAQQLNGKVLLQYDIDRLLAGYRKQSGLPAKATSYPNWDGLDGHVGGHYLSALAMNYAATKNSAFKNKMDYMIAELKLVEQSFEKKYPAWAKGYIGAVPNSDKIWSTFSKGDFNAFRSAWVPFYNIHKMYAGLRDAWLYTGNKSAKDMFLKFCDWGNAITSSLTETQMQSVLDVEHGGMNEIFADAYEMTGDEKYLTAAKRFSHHMLLEAMSAHKDNLDNKHANTQVPKAIGFQRIGELANDDIYKSAGSFFWTTVTQNRSLAIGGNSRREFFPGVNSATDFVKDVEGPESCNSYNMLKLTEDLFRINPDAVYADYYERTLYNHILSTQHPVHGGYVYFTPARPRHYRVYSTPNQGMWCCVGSGMENHGKYGQFIYTKNQNELFVNLFIPSQLNWREKKLKLKQLTGFPFTDKTSVTITEGAANFTLNVRYPFWVKEGALRINVNGKAVSLVNKPSSYVAIKRNWKKGDIVTIELPMSIRIEQLPNVSNYYTFMYGPILLAAKTGTEDMQGLVANDGRWAHIASGKKLPLDQAPIIIDDNIASLAEKIKPVPGKLLSFSLAGIKMVNQAPLELQPFFSLHDARYMMYWMTLSNNSYKSYLDSIAAIEKKNLELEKRTVDFVAPGEQQPEADHFIQKQNSNTGNNNEAFWRDARGDGFFSYQLSTNKQTGLSLLIKYWGAEWGNRKFEIYIDDQKLITVDNTGKWNKSDFQFEEYAIPDEMIKEKDKIRVKFQSIPGNTAGAVYYLRLIKKQ